MDGRGAGAASTAADVFARPGALSSAAGWFILSSVETLI
jgi:hypothetical protein